jgi:hypothetical protein
LYLKVGDVVYIEIYDNYKNLIVDNKDPKIITALRVESKFRTIIFGKEGYDVSIKKMKF